jgi:colanic acid/amylovoran biosynthesis glycosyltransferase
LTIAFVIPSLPGYSETFLTNKIKGLQASGFEVVLMVVGVSDKRKMDVPVYYQPILAATGPLRWLYTLWLILKSVAMHPTKSRKLLREAEIAGYKAFGKWRMLAVLSNFLKIKTDWIHFAYGTMAIERAFIGRVLNAKVGLSLRGYDICIYQLQNPNGYTPVWPFINKVHSISTDLLAAAKREGLPEITPFQIIYPAIDSNRFAEVTERSWNEKPSFLTVARLHWKKGLEYTLDALAKLDFDFSYTLIGDGPEKERLVFASHQLGIANKVHFVGKKSESEVAEAMRSHNYYVQYSVQEGFCNAVLEAQAAGMLCIVSDAEGLSENVLHEQTGWVVPKRNASALAAQIKIAMALSEFKKRSMTELAINRVKTDFNLEKQRQQFASFFSA